MAHEQFFGGTMDEQENVSVVEGHDDQARVKEPEHDPRPPWVQCGMTFEEWLELERSNRF